MLKSLFHWKVLVNLIVAIGVFVGLVWLTFRWLEYHTDHLKEIPVPNVIDKSVHEAIKILDDAGLEYEVDSLQYNPKFKPFQVLKMYPAPGAKVKRSRAIQIIINPKTWAPVQVPDVLDRYKGLAFRQLEQVGLKVGDTIYEANIQRDALIRMEMNGEEVRPGALVPRFSIINVIIGTGPKRDMPVPNLIGLTVAEAEQIIKQNLFEIGVIEHEDGGQDKADIIYYQDPDSRALRDQGIQIDLWASKKTPGQMMEKIEQLNSIYRLKIDTTLPPIHYREIMEDIPLSIQKISESREVIPAEKPKEKEVVKNKVSEKPKENPKPSQSEKKEVPSTPAKPAVEEKPKVKQIIIE